MATSKCRLSDFEPRSFVVAKGRRLAGASGQEAGFYCRARLGSSSKVLGTEGGQIGSANLGMRSLVHMTRFSWL